MAIVMGLAIAICITPKAYAQRYPVFGSLSIGPSIPLGSFAGTTSDKSGFAKTGYTVLLSGGVFLNSPLAVTILATASFAKNRDPYWGGNTNYMYNAILAGPTYRIKDIGKFSIEVRGLAGFSQSQIGESIGCYTNGNGFGYDVGVNVRFFISPAWTLNFSTDYLNANIKYNNDYGNHKIQSLNICVGAGFFF